MYYEFNGRLYAFAYENGPLCEYSEAGSPIRIVVDKDEESEVLKAMLELQLEQVGF